MVFSDEFEDGSADLNSFYRYFSVASSALVHTGRKLRGINAILAARDSEVSATKRL